MAMTFLSCSVIEERTGCPCIVEIDMEDEIWSSGADIIVHGTHGSISYYHFAAHEMDSSVTIEVTDRDRADVLVCPASLSDHVRDDLGIVLSSGLPCPDMFLFATDLDTSQEHIVVKAVAHKNHCDVNVRFENSFPSSCLLELHSSFCGISLSGRPLEGAYRQHVALSETGMVSCRLPRQADASASLDIIPSSGSVRHIALGSLMQQAGYDWDAEDLEDINLTIDYTTSVIRLECGAWDKEIFIPVVI